MYDVLQFFLLCIGQKLSTINGNSNFYEESCYVRPTVQRQHSELSPGLGLKTGAWHVTGRAGNYTLEARVTQENEIEQSSTYWPSPRSLLWGVEGKKQGKSSL